MEKYLNAELSPRERALDLLSKMSLEEKVAQLGCENVNPKDLDNLDIPATGCAVLGVVREGKYNEATKKLQSYIIKHSPHHIPALLHAEGLSGPVCLLGGCQFPAPIGLGATFEPEIVKEMAGFTSKQLAANGIRHALSPVLDLARDLRWGRCNETYGGDPTLSAAMSVNFIQGMQGEDLRYGVAATCKHFLGYSASESGLNMHVTTLPYTVIREQYAKPFEAAINLAGVKTVMNSYSVIDGRSVCSNKKILTDLLRGDLGFTGATVSDYSAIAHIKTMYRLAETAEDTAVLSLNAGMDIEFPDNKYYGEPLIQAVKDGKIEESVVDRSVMRLLTLKFELGLFENPYGVGNLEEAMDNTAANAASLKAAKKTITLLKNDGILPITDKNAKIAVIGPTGNTLRLLYGHYTAVGAWESLKVIDTIRAEMGASEQAGNLFNPEEAKKRKIRPREIESKYIFDDEIRAAYPLAKTIFEGIKEKFANVKFVEGCDYKGKDTSGFSAARKLAAESDYVIICVGEKSSIDPSCTSGEGADCASLALAGVQDELVKAVYEANKNCVIVHTGCKPYCSEWVYENIPAVLEAWFPATFGGEAIASVICGEYNPSGKTPVDLPRDAGHTPVYFSQLNGSSSDTHENFGIRGYIDSPSTCLIPFGYGLSYTKFEYGERNIYHDGKGNITITVTVKNAGERDGDEVVQLYGRDLYASMVRPRRELIGFKRVSLKAGEQKTVIFKFNIDILAFTDINGKWITEAGDFEFYAGADSTVSEPALLYRLEKSFNVNPNRRTFFAEAQAE